MYVCACACDSKRPLNPRAWLLPGDSGATTFSREGLGEALDMKDWTWKLPLKLTSMPCIVVGYLDLVLNSLVGH